MIRVVKIGGNVVDNQKLLRDFCRDFARMEGPRCLVHGGGVMASELDKALGHEPLKIEGRRVTDADTLRTVTMVYAGLCNKTIVSLLQAEGCNAIGLSGCDADVIRAPKRVPRILSDGITRVDYGFVGDVTAESVRTGVIEKFIEMGLVPVFCAINHDGKGNLLNTNADTIACSVASALKAELIYCFEKNGVLSDKDNDKSVIPVINPEYFITLRNEGRVAEGMLPKLENSFAALRKGASGVVIKHSRDLLGDSGTKLVL